ncbi:MAG: hypothetical protein LQ338_007265 [Usnochroma carphineum]|nr:MAG: hypothetical protein LQ338_007265 [Usnochroma carphineum]
MALAFATSTFDYLIAGGGTAGLTLAARLTEDPAVVVGVVEAGVDRSGESRVVDPGLATGMWGDGGFDWGFESVGQTNGRVVAHPRGKMLGGSSGINLNLWTHASQKDIDDWGLLGNEGWSWAELLPYYKRSENYLAPPADEVQAEDIHFVEPSCHGEGGPVQNKFPPFYSDFYDAWAPTFAHLNLSVQSDPKCGLGLGGAATLVTFNETNARSYAGNTYYALSKDRPNLKVLTNALVTKINFHPTKDEDGNLVATGLSFSSDGKSFTAIASREVLISAGTFQSPQLLELSGIGSPSILSRHNIPVLYANPAVGENLQDHVLVPLGFVAAPGEPTQESFRNLTLLQEALELYASKHMGPFAASTPTAYLSYRQLVDNLLPEDRPPPLPPLAPTPQIVSPFSSKGSTQEQLTLDRLHSPAEAAAQILFIPGGTTPEDVSNTTAFLQTGLPGNYFTLFGVLEHPFSRGNVHVVSADPGDKVSVDPRYLSDARDVAVLGAVALFLRRLARTGPLSDHLADNGTRLQPGFPEELDGGNVVDFVRGAFSSEYHPVGTCGMGLRGGEDGGGVVDHRFRVYGTGNLRVVDASVVPLMVRGNLASLVYAVAERGADFIREDQG